MSIAAKRPPAGLLRYQSEVAATKRTALVEAASRIFLAIGYDRATVGAIAREAGVSLATLYKHFAAKSDLFGAVIEHLVSALNERIAAINLKDLDVILALRQFAESYATLLRRPDTIAVFRIIIAEGSRFPELKELFRERAKEPVGQRFEAFLTERSARGDVMIDEPARAKGRFFGVLDHFLLWPGLFDPNWRPDDKDISTATDDAIAALTAPALADHRRQRKPTRRD